MRVLATSLALLTFIWGINTQVSAEPSAKELEDILYLDLKSGRVAIKLRPDLAPNHVKTRQASGPRRLL